MPMPSFSLLDERRPTMSVLFGCERVLGGDLKVHEVEAFRDVGFLLNSLYSGFFLRVCFNFVFDDGGHVNLTEVFIRRQVC